MSESKRVRMDEASRRFRDAIMNALEEHKVCVKEETPPIVFDRVFFNAAEKTDIMSDSLLRYAWGVSLYNATTEDECHWNDTVMRDLVEEILNTVKQNSRNNTIYAYRIDFHPSWDNKYDYSGQISFYM